MRDPDRLGSLFQKEIGRVRPISFVWILFDDVSLTALIPVAFVIAMRSLTPQFGY